MSILRKFISPTNLGYKTIENLRAHLDKVKHLVDYWEKEHLKIAFGEITDGDFSYQDWADIHIKKGWKEVPPYMCFINPVEFTVKNEYGGSVTPKTQYHSFEYDKAMLHFWKEWYYYYRQWNFRINKLEMARFDIRRVTQADNITVEEALFICLGLSPSVIDDVGFKSFSLKDKRSEFQKIELDSINYFDYQGNRLSIDTDMYDEDGYGMIEWELVNNEEYRLIERNEGFKSEDGSLSSKKFLKWAFKHDYLEEYKIKYRILKQSPWGEAFAKKLYSHLIKEGCIQGEFESLWQWNYPWFTLHYLANELVSIGLIKTKTQFKDIKQYIDCDADLRKYYSENTDPDSPADKKLRTKGCDEVDKALRPLERENDKIVKKELD